MLSCTRPWRCEEESMPTPATAPPRVMVFSCGTTAGITPCARQSATSASYVTMPSASTWPSLIRSTSLKWRTSSRRRARRRARGTDSRCPSPARPARSISTMVSARLGIQPPGKTCLRMKNSVWKRPTWPMKCSMPRPPGFRNLACARTTSASWSRPACSSVPIETTLSYSARIAEIAEHLQGAAEPPPLDLAAHHVGLRGGGIDAGDAHSEALVGMEHEAAEAGADVDHLFARREQQLPRHVVDLVPLRLLERARALLPVRAGVHHQRIVEPQAVELGAERVVEIGVGPCLAPRGVGEAQLVPPVANAHQRLGAVHAAFHPRCHGHGEVALDVEVAIEIRFEQADVPEGGDAPVRARVAEHQRERRRLLGSPVLATPGEADRERDAGALADLAQRGFDQGSHGPAF